MTQESKLTVRRARGPDQPAWLGMRRRLWKGSREAHAADIRAHSRRRGFVCFIARQGKRAVGFAEASIRPFANGCDSSPVPFLEGLWVDPAFRRRRVGHELVRAVEAWALRGGFGELGSDAYLSARISHLAHRAYGFKETERVVYFSKKLRR